MLYRSLCSYIVTSLLIYSSAYAGDIGIYNKGKLKLHGNIVEGACVVSVNDRVSEELIVDMGSYRSDQLKGGGYYPEREYVTFKINVGQCNIDSSRNIELIFNGETAIADKTLFKVYPGMMPLSHKQESNNNEDVGMGLALFDQNHNMLYPNVMTNSLRFRGKDGVLVFLAKYKVIQNKVNVGNFFSEINFNVFYP